MALLLVSLAGAASSSLSPLPLAATVAPSQDAASQASSPASPPPVSAYTTVHNNAKLLVCTTVFVLWMCMYVYVYVYMLHVLLTN